MESLSKMENVLENISGRFLSPTRSVGAVDNELENIGKGTA